MSHGKNDQSGGWGLREKRSQFAALWDLSWTIYPEASLPKTLEKKLKMKVLFLLLKHLSLCMCMSRVCMSIRMSCACMTTHMSRVFGHVCGTCVVTRMPFVVMCASCTCLAMSMSHVYHVVCVMCEIMCMSRVCTVMWVTVDARRRQ